MQQFSGNSPDIGLNGLDRLSGVDHMYLLRQSGLVQKTLPYTLTILVTLAFHPVERPIQTEVCAFNTHIEHEHTVGHQSARCDFPDLPNLPWIQAAGMPLINDICQQIPIGNDNLTRVERRPDDLVDKLRPRRHVQQHLAAAVDRRGRIDREQQVTNPFTKWRAARITANDDVEAMAAQRFLEQANLRRFANSVDAVEREKQLVTFFVNRGHILYALGNCSAKASGL
jgi:hypothetical protein